MLKMKIVSTSVRTAAWCRTQRNPSAMSCAHRGSSVPGRAAVRRAARPATPAARRQPPAPPGSANGQAAPGREQGRADRRAGELVERDEAGLQPGVGDARGRRGAPASAAACWRCCRRTPRPCRAGTARPARPAIVTVAGDHRPTQQRRARRPRQQVGGHDDAAGGRAGRRATPAYRPNTQRRQPLQQRGQRRPGTGRAVCEATSSGPAAMAMPSPRLRRSTTTRAASGSRRPSRAGTTVSTIRLTSRRRSQSPP